MGARSLGITGRINRVGLVGRSRRLLDGNSNATRLYSGDSSLRPLSASLSLHPDLFAFFITTIDDRLAVIDHIASRLELREGVPKSLGANWQRGCRRPAIPHTITFVLRAGAACVGA
jgi:hypothetical protein